MPFPVGYVNTHTEQSEKLQEKSQNAEKSLPADLRITDTGGRSSTGIIVSFVQQPAGG
jgi:hypothetical protein